MDKEIEKVIADLEREGDRRRRSRLDCDYCGVVADTVENAVDTIRRLDKELEHYKAAFTAACKSIKG